MLQCEPIYCRGMDIRVAVSVRSMWCQMSRHNCCHIHYFLKWRLRQNKAFQTGHIWEGEFESRCFSQAMTHRWDQCIYSQKLSPHRCKGCFKQSFEPFPSRETASWTHVILSIKKSIKTSQTTSAGSSLLSHVQHSFDLYLQQSCSWQLFSLSIDLLKNLNSGLNILSMKCQKVKMLVGFSHGPGWHFQMSCFVWSTVKTQRQFADCYVTKESIKSSYFKSCNQQMYGSFAFQKTLLKHFGAGAQTNTPACSKAQQGHAWRLRWTCWCIQLYTGVWVSMSDQKVLGRWEVMPKVSTDILIYFKSIVEACKGLQFGAKEIDTEE